MTEKKSFVQFLIASPLNKRISPTTLESLGNLPDRNQAIKALCLELFSIMLSLEPKEIKKLSSELIKAINYGK